MEIENKKETPKHDTNYGVARNRIDAYGCGRIFKTPKSQKIIEKLKADFTNNFIWNRDGSSFEFVNLDCLVSVFKYRDSYLLNFKTGKELLSSQFMVRSDIYNDLIKTLEERNRYDILLNLGISYDKD
jgi:hypothetical protein